MKKSLPWGRCLAGILAALLFAVGVDSLVHWWRMRSECAAAAVAELAVFPEAFGRQGTVQAEFCPKYKFTCKEMLLVEYAPAERSRDDVAAMVDGLNADLVIADAAGNVLLQETLTKVLFHPYWTWGKPGTCLPAYLFRPVAPGRYQLRLTVHSPALRLVNRPHRVVARYELCGIESLAVAFTGGIALLAIVMAASLAVGIIVVTRKKKRQNN